MWLCYFGTNDLCNLRIVEKFFTTPSPQNCDYTVLLFGVKKNLWLRFPEYILCVTHSTESFVRTVVPFMKDTLPGRLVWLCPFNRWERKVLLRDIAAHGVCITCTLWWLRGEFSLESHYQEHWCLPWHVCIHPVVTAVHASDPVELFALDARKVVWNSW